MKLTTAVILSATLALSAALPASAQTTTPTAEKAPTREAARMERMHATANKEIDRRTAALDALSARVQAMKHITDSDKTSLEGMITAEASNLAALKTTIAADTDLTTLKADIQSITKSYRIFMLIIPRGHIIAAADRVNDVAGAMGDVGTKLQTRITAAQAAGNDVATLNTALTDLTAKLTDAKTNAAAAIAEISGLTPDNGDQAVMNANTAALRDARKKINAAQADIKAARQDAQTIIKGLKAMKQSGTATTTGTTGQ